MPSRIDSSSSSHRAQTALCLMGQEEHFTGESSNTVMWLDLRQSQGQV
ncbi:MAG: hypothetical protein R6V30_08310 [Paracoccaceae bacterium]|nr:hypothetical protein [Loktanella sp.]